MRTLRRPMFRRGGSTGEGITSGLKRQGYDNGNTVQPRRPNTNLNNFLIDFGLDLVSRSPQGGLLATAGAAAKNPFSRFQARDVAQRDRDYERQVYEDKMKFQREQFDEQKKQFRQELEQDKYLGELEAQGEKQFIEEQINNYWDPLVEAELDGEKKRVLLQEKAADKYNVIVMGADISDKYKILSNAQATEQAVTSAETEIGNTINSATGQNWAEEDAGYSEKLQVLTNKYMRLATKFLKEDQKADGGRIGYQNAGPVMPEQAMDQEETNQINISYEQLRERLPQEISDEIVTLLSQSYEAFADFAEIQTQADVNEFNTKYNVQLFLPRQPEA